jgi:hypothetical protein
VTAVLAATRRFAVLVGGLASATAAASLALGLLLGSPAGRSVAVGLYLAGCALLLGGFFVGSSGPFRVANEEGLVGIRRARGIRVVSGSESAESSFLTGLLVLVGVVLIALGAAVDSNARLI